PGICLRECFGIYFMKDCRGIIDLHSPFSGRAPILAVDLLGEPYKLIKSSIAFQLDLQFGNIVILSIIQMGEQSSVDDLRNLLISSPDLLGLGDIKHDHLGGKSLVNKIHQFADPSVFELILEKVAVSVVLYCRVGQYIAEILSEGRLAGAK